MDKQASEEKVCEREKEGREEMKMCTWIAPVFSQVKVVEEMQNRCSHQDWNE